MLSLYDKQFKKDKQNPFYNMKKAYYPEKKQKIN